ncbi:MFS transporter [uncultured Ruthenibacterium sp.]|uniref:MFS transporter n=1 Tax=uncultured Ruthenibacterium sp. TaxID=1905347 RepID=UPI00349EF258
MDTKQKNISFALIAISFLTLASSAVSPALASMGQAYPDVPATLISLLTTLPSLLAVPMTLLCGQIAGKYVSYRALVIGGLLCNLISGVAPAFTQNFYLLLVWRGLFGCGTGILSPLIMPMMMATFEGQRVYRQASYNAIATNIGAVVFQMLGGVVCAAMGWKAMFMIYFLILPVLLLVAKIMPEPPRQEKSKDSPPVTFSLLKPSFKWCVLYFTHMVLFYVSVTEISGVVMESGFGTSTVSAVLLSLTTLVGVAGSYLYKSVNHRGTGFLGLSYLSLAAGYYVMAISGNVFVMAVGAILIGIGFGINMPAAQVYVGQSVPGYARNVAASILAVCGNIGGFLSKFILAGITGFLGLEGGRNAFLVCVVGYLVLAFLMGLLALLKRGKSDVKGMDKRC